MIIEHGRCKPFADQIAYGDYRWCAELDCYLVFDGVDSDRILGYIRFCPACGAKLPPPAAHAGEVSP